MKNLGNSMSANQNNSKLLSTYSLKILEIFLTVLVSIPIKLVLTVDKVFFIFLKLTLV